MAVHLQREIAGLKKKILVLGSMVEERLHDAVQAVTERNLDMANKVIDADIEVDNMEVEVEEDCLKILALHQPVAIDLRFIVSVLKINNDLERIGDLAVNIAKRAAFLVKHGKAADPFDIPDMARKVQLMLKGSLDALVNADVAMARGVCAADDEIDELNRTMYKLILSRVKSDVNNLDSDTHLLSVSRHLERIADLATNIAEDVVYMIDGHIIRHRTASKYSDSDE